MELGEISEKDKKVVLWTKFLLNPKSLKEKIDIKTIMKVTELTKEEIEEIQNEL